MKAKRENASMKVRVATIAVCLVIVVLVSALSGHHGSSTGGDPCASGNTPQVCEAQQAIDQTHALENAQAEGRSR